ncbi:MAG: carbon-nitrogen hydrolase family protein [Candidatus Heimdallarchaeota archaeon]|nr:carbon-nitrogen hydrolase family protein [Candidatus Heimdallarchaeota archaeon]
MKVAVIQISPIFLNKKETWSKMKIKITEAIDSGAELITWGETLLPGYPQWISPSGGAKFNDNDQKVAYATYLKNSVPMNDPIIKEMQQLAKEGNAILMGGIAEREATSVYATLITVGNDGEVWGRHRKVKPTYEERLVWSDGDGKGLQVFDTPIGKLGGLNCWENWIPYARAALHRQGEVIHVAVWPGNLETVENISKFMALEGRSWVISASGMLSRKDFSHLTTEELPMKSVMEANHDFWQNGGSMIVSPEGKIVAGPLVEREGIISTVIDEDIILRERHNFDYDGHYSRKDIFDFKIRN